MLLQAVRLESAKSLHMDLTKSDLDSKVRCWFWMVFNVHANNVFGTSWHIENQMEKKNAFTSSWLQKYLPFSLGKFPYGANGKW